MTRVVLRPASADDRPELEGLLADYLFEFDGRTDPYPYLDAYWTEPERFPFLIEADGKTVGLCLIRVRHGGWSIAEFSVVPSERRSGVGRAAVESLAAQARAAGAAHLEAKIHPDNDQTLAFWSAVGFEEIPSPDVFTTRRPL